MKKEIASTPVLAYYNPKKQTVLQTDASIIGLGACLVQDEKPVCFVSKALTDAQKGYVSIELELLGVSWAMEKLHHFLYQSHFILEKDRNPLEVILTKSINQATPRLKSILIKTFPYHFTVHFIHGLTNQLADCLSWLGGQKDTINLPELHLYQIASQLCAWSDSLHQLKLAIQEDDELALLKHTLTQGWPSIIKEVPNVLQLHWTFREELTVEDGLVLKGTRIAIPIRKCEPVSNLIHEGHLGLNKCKLHAKDTVYWPGLNEQLGKLILNCE